MKVTQVYSASFLLILVQECFQIFLLLNFFSVFNWKLTYFDNIVVTVRVVAMSDVDNKEIRRKFGDLFAFLNNLGKQICLVVAFSDLHDFPSLRVSKTVIFFKSLTLVRDLVDLGKHLVRVVLFSL